MEEMQTVPDEDGKLHHPDYFKSIKDLV